MVLEGPHAGVRALPREEDQLQRPAAPRPLPDLHRARIARANDTGGSWFQ